MAEDRALRDLANLLAGLSDVERVEIRDRAVWTYGRHGRYRFTVERA